MATIQHADLRGEQVHEPKNIETARTGDVYKADGNGSGSWDRLQIGELTGYEPTGDGLLTRRIGNVTTTPVGTTYAYVRTSSPISITSSPVTLNSNNLSMSVSRNISLVTGMQLIEAGVYKIEGTAVFTGGAVEEGDNSNEVTLITLVGGNSAQTVTDSVNNGDKRTTSFSLLVQNTGQTEVVFSVASNKELTMDSFFGSIVCVGE